MTLAVCLTFSHGEASTTVRFVKMHVLPLMKAGECYQSGCPIAVAHITIIILRTMNNVILVA